ncbi:MAG: MBL fold metallo-hydrolase [Candidatus Kryptoniota bacterium]
MKVHVIDLKFHASDTIAAYLIESNSELALIETGPDSVFHNLEMELRKLGFSIYDVKKVFVTHIHLDHAGAAWHFAESGATIFVHPNGVRHLVDPGKLLSSAERIYKERMRELWGDVRPVSEAMVRQVIDGEKVTVGNTTIEVLDTQGHASHHNTYFVEGNAFTGDVGGVRIKGGPVLPPTPAPDINVELWLESIKKIRQKNPSALYPTHFGKSEDVQSYLDELETRLVEWTEWIGRKLKEGKNEDQIIVEFDSFVRESLQRSGVSNETVEAYRSAIPFWMNVPGLVRYWQKFRMK